MNINLSEDTRSFFRSGGLTFLSCLAIMVIMPVYIHIMPPFLILWVIFWIFENRSVSKKDIFANNKATILLLLFLLFYLWQITGLLWSDSLNSGFERLFKRLSLLLFPLVLFYPGSRIVKNINLITRLFAVSTFLYLIFCFGNALHHSLVIDDHKWIFNPHPTDYDYENFFYGSRFSYPVHPSYMAMYIVVSVLISFEAVSDKTRSYLERGLWTGMILIFIVVSYLLSARAGLLAELIVLPCYLFIKYYRLFPKWIVLILFITVAGMLVIVVRKNDRVSATIQDISKENSVESLNNDPRLHIWKSALSVARENLILGVGTGDATNELKEEFVSRGYIDGYYDNLNAHNQFLSILLENGLIGLIIFVGTLVYMVTMAIKQSNILYGMFVITIVVFFTFETMLNRLAGVSFFSLFSFLFIYAGTNNLAASVNYDKTKSLVTKE